METFNKVRFYSHCFLLIFSFFFFFLQVMFRHSHLMCSVSLYILSVLSVIVRLTIEHYKDNSGTLLTHHWVVGV